MSRVSVGIVLAVLVAAGAGCSSDSSGPGNPVKTTKLEAEKLSAAPGTSFWANADFIEFTASSTGGNGSTNQAYAGEYNMTGSKTGFDVTVRMKAAYTATDLYIYAEWTDPTATNDLNRRRWFFNGGAADAIPTFNPVVTGRTAAEMVPPGWSSNLNDDKIAVMWDILQGGVGASTSGGTLFATAGCSITCHSPNDMYADNGRTDLWHFKTSRSNPLGYVNDQYTDPIVLGRVTDAGETIESRNRPSGGTNTSGPQFVWDPTKLNRIVRWDGITIDLDPALFLAATATMPIEGDAIAGNVGITDPTDQNNLVARIRGFTGAPGYTVKDVTDFDDAVYVTNYPTIYSAGQYTLILKRKLVTGKPTEDAQFDDLAAEYPFSVAIMDYDGKNHAGGALQTMKFRP